MQIGDLIYMSRSMLEMGYPEMGIVVGMKGKHYVVGFTNGIVQWFHPKFVKDKPVKRRNSGK
tara:strand:- start:46 stop:231 length:186 start_codon:yes stop_codon:yes gene_type:complete